MKIPFTDPGSGPGTCPGSSPGTRPRLIEVLVQASADAPVHYLAKKSAWFSGRYTYWSSSIVATFPVTIFSYQSATFLNEPLLNADLTSRSNSPSLGSSPSTYPGSCPGPGSIVLEPTRL
jgi:hypothetical protein